MRSTGGGRTDEKRLRMREEDPGGNVQSPEMRGALKKVCALITRRGKAGEEVLLFRHPYAGVQIPAGTVEPGESEEAAALREACEETGLGEFAAQRYLGCQDEILPEGQAVILERTSVYARPDPGSFDWAYLRGGITVSVERKAPGFTQVTYRENDQEPQRRKHGVLAESEKAKEGAQKLDQPRYLSHVSLPLSAGRVRHPRSASSCDTRVCVSTSFVRHMRTGAPETQRGGRSQISRLPALATDAAATSRSP